VAGVNTERVKELLQPNQVELKALINKSAKKGEGRK